MAIGTPIATGYSPIIPTSGQTQWDGPLSALLQAIKDAIEAQVPGSAIDIQADLSVNGNRVVDLLGIRLTVAATDPGVANSAFISGSVPEWYLRDGSNNRIQLTAGGFLNVQGSGSIGGDYSNSSAAAIYTNSTGRFGFTSSPGVFAVLEQGGLRIHNGSSTGAVTVAAQAGLANTFTLTLPGALPTNGGSTIVTCDATGGLDLLASSSITHHYGIHSAYVAGVTNTLGPSGTVGVQSVSDTFNLDFSIPYDLGDRIDSVTILGSGFNVTGSILKFNQAGQSDSLVRACFNDPTNLLTTRTIQAGLATLTGTMPFTPNSGSMVLRIGCGRAASQFDMTGFEVTRTRRIIG